jgi:hypothetical protein
MDSTGYGIIDEALERLERFGFESASAGATHAPMVAETLCALGRGDAVMSWIDSYAPRLEPRPRLAGRVGTADWQPALGQFGLLGGWVGLFDQELSEKPWRGVLNQWLPRLAPGMAAAALHGLIRTAHAARALGTADTPQRRHELAQGLAYWAARYLALPGVAKSGGRVRASQALSLLQTFPREAGQPFPPDMITGLLGLYSFPAFNEAINLVEDPSDPSRFLSDLTEEFAGAFITNEGGFSAAVAFLHSVTAPSAIRLLLPHVEPAVTRMLLRHCWQVTAGLYTAFGPVPRMTEISRPAPNVATLVDGAVQIGVKTSDPHVIKFAEACAREYQFNASPLYLIAADLATRILAEHPT